MTLLERFGQTHLTCSPGSQQRNGPLLSQILANIADDLFVLPGSQKPNSSWDPPRDQVAFFRILRVSLAFIVPPLLWYCSLAHRSKETKHAKCLSPGSKFLRAAGEASEASHVRSVSESVCRSSFLFCVSLVPVLLRFPRYHSPMSHLSIVHSTLGSNNSHPLISASHFIFATLLSVLPSSARSAQVSNILLCSLKMCEAKSQVQSTGCFNHPIENLQNVSSDCSAKYLC